MEREDKPPRLRIVLAGLVACLACGPVEPGQLGVEEWREDLEYMASKLVERHGNAFHQVERETFEAAVSELNDRMATLESHEILVELGRIVALIGDGHTELWLRQEAVGFSRLPIGLHYFNDELYIFAATADHTHLVGKRVVAIGDVPTPEAYQRVIPLIARDNDYEYLRSAPLYLVVPEILQALGMAATASETIWTLDGPDGESDVRIRPLEPSSTPTWTRAWELAGSAAPLYLQRQERWYWFEYLRDSKTVYVKYSRCKDQPREDSIKRFAARLFDFVDENPVERFVVDLRHNTGGNYHRNAPLIEGIAKRPQINRQGHLFVLTSRTTFSAATLAAIHLKQQTQVLIVGEPSRGKPNGYSDEKHLRLPKSGIEVNYSPLYRAAMPELDSPYLPVDLAVESSFADYRSGRDPVLDAALDFGSTARQAAGREIH